MDPITRQSLPQVFLMLVPPQDSDFTERFTDWGDGRVEVTPPPLVAETPAQHVRNALTMLSLIEQTATATWVLNPELGRCARRAEAALVLLENDGPPQFADMHLRKAIETLIEVQLDWAVIPVIPAIMIRLFTAWFAVLRAIDGD
jgi:hypothetical protein